MSFHGRGRRVTPVRKRENRERYFKQHIVKRAEAKGITVEEAEDEITAIRSSIRKSKQAEAHKRKILKSRQFQKDEKPLFLTDGKLIAQIVSGGGGPGTGKKK